MLNYIITVNINYLSFLKPMAAKLIKNFSRNKIKNKYTN